MTRSGGRLALAYRMEGDLRDVVLAARGPRSRADALWKHSCFELFVAGGGGYGEINLSPSNRWAAYRFDGYREGMRPDEGAALVHLDDRRSAAVYELAAELEIAGPPPHADWSVGLSAVVELVGGARCFWALRHAAGKPDFHHPDTFALTLGPSESP